MLQLAEDEGNKFPLAVPPLTKGRYMDDLFGGADTIEQAQETALQLFRICMAGGFPLKWISNEPSVLKFIPIENLISSVSVQIDSGMIVHTLGLCWQPTIDTF